MIKSPDLENETFDIGWRILGVAFVWAFPVTVKRKNNHENNGTNFSLILSINLYL